MMKTHTKRAYTISGAMLVAGCAVYAQTETTSATQKSLDPVTLTAETESLEGNDVTAEELKIENPADLKTLFKKSPSVLVNGGANLGQQIFVNNLESPLLNVTIDGASQSNLFHHSSSILIEPGLLKRVEVLPGAGSALNGPGALAGAIRFETKNAFDYLPLTAAGESFQRIGADSKATYFNNGDGYSFSQTIYGKLNREWGYLFNGSYADRDSYEDGNGDTVPFTDYTRKNGLFKLSGRLDGGHSIDFGVELFEDNTFTYTRVNIDPSALPPNRLGTFQKFEATRTTATLSYDYNPDTSDLINLESTFFYTDQDFDRATTGLTSAVETFGIDLRNTFEFWRLKTTVGFDYQDRTGSADYGTEFPTFNPDQDQEEDVFGIYNQNLLSLHENVDFSFGFRYDSYDYEDGFGNEYDSSQLSPNASIIWRPVQCLSIDAGYAEAYRGVGIREAYLADGVRPDDLDGEEASTLKAGFKYDNDLIFASGSIYRQKVDNYLYPSPYRPPYTRDLCNEGYDLRVGFRKDGFTGSVAMAYSKPELDGESVDDLGVVVAGRRWIADLNYAHPDNGLSCGWSMEYRESADGNASIPDGKDDYFLNHLYLAWNVPEVEGLRLQLNVDNVFDELYMDHTLYTAAGLNSPGREIRLSANYTF